jgi:hypothetical protein
MSNDISDLMKLSPLRSNRFKVEMSKLDNVKYTIESVDLPDSGINTFPFQFDNKTPTLIPYAANYGGNSISMVFRENEEQASPYPSVLKWLDEVIIRNHRARTYKIPYFNDIVSDMNIICEATDDSPVYIINFIDCYPISAKLSSLDMNARDAYVTSTIVMSFAEFSVS